MKIQLRLPSLALALRSGFLDSSVAACTLHCRPAQLL